ncbi:MAG: imidazole glycerol phosphate synthase subunit HisH [Pseudoflavonifractor sp.]|nr:imidazole glycerol phosphate synthase subunit HisH [Pseudoflavonifractor sp.]
MRIAIIKYNAGNNFSVLCALRRIGVEAVVTDDVSVIRGADRVIFPGVGEAAAAMDYLRANHLDSLITSLTQPVLGICIGQQLLCRHSNEGDVDCLGVFDEDVRRFSSDDPSFKVPHMGWNTLSDIKGGFLPQELAGRYVYYVHSYYVPVGRYTEAVTEYVVPFSAVLRRDNFYATQFHPEKSGSVGEAILKRFIEL